MRRVDKKGIEHLCRNLAAVLLFSLPFPLALSPSFSGKEKRNRKGQSKSPKFSGRREGGIWNWYRGWTREQGNYGLSIIHIQNTQTYQTQNKVARHFEFIFFFPVPSSTLELLELCYAYCPLELLLPSPGLADLWFSIPTSPVPPAPHISSPCGEKKSSPLNPPNKPSTWRVCCGR